MTFSIQNNYSILNRYDYENKSPFISSLDWLSAPCRKVLGGRNVCVLSQTYGNQTSTTNKVIIAFFSVLIWPIATISIASLLIKCATCPWIWERKKVDVQSQQTWDIIDQFDQACKAADTDKAIQTFMKRPEIGKRREIYINFFKLTNQKINEYTPWNNLYPLFSFLQTNDAIELINYAVMMQLKQQYKKGESFISAKEIILFVQNALKPSSLANIEDCYNKIFSNALRIDVNDDLLLNATKMDLADHLIRSLIQMKTANAENDLQRMAAQVDEKVLRYKIFDKTQNYSQYYLIFDSAEQMTKISAIIQNIRDIKQMGGQFINNLTVLLAQNEGQQEHWLNIRSEFIKFQRELNRLTTSLSKEEKKYIKALQVVLDRMITFTDLIWKASAVEEIASVTKEIETSLAEQTKNFGNFFDNKKISYSQSDIENFLTSLCLQRNADILTFAEQAKACLLKNMVQILPAVIS